MAALLLSDGVAMTRAERSASYYQVYCVKRNLSPINIESSTSHRNYVAEDSNYEIAFET